VRSSRIARRRESWILVFKGVIFQASVKDFDQRIQHFRHCHAFQPAGCSSNDQSVRSKQIFNALEALALESTFGKVTFQKGSRQSICVGLACNLTTQNVPHSNNRNDQGRPPFSM